MKKLKLVRDKVWNELGKAANEEVFKETGHYVNNLVWSRIWTPVAIQVEDLVADQLINLTLLPE